MHSKYDRPRVVVVGAGVMGLTTALALTHAGYVVTVLECGSAAREASWAGGGILAPLCPWQAPPAVQELVAESLALYPGLCADLLQYTGIDPQLRQSGMWVLDASQLDAGLAWCRQQSLAATCIALTAAHGLHPRYASALQLPWVMQVRNPRLCQALLARIAQLQVPVQSNVGPVRWQQQGSLHRLIAPKGEWQADAVVACMGAWAGDWLAETGWQLPIYPVAGQMLLLAPPQQPLANILYADGRYLIPRADGQVLVGSTLEETGFGGAADAQGRHTLLRFAAQLMPQLAGATALGHWRGFRPGSPEGIPTIAPHPERPSLLANAGHFRYGLTMAPASAARVVQLLQQTL
jgi:glycine oxidase